MNITNDLPWKTFIKSLYLIVKCQYKVADLQCIPHTKKTIGMVLVTYSERNYSDILLKVERIGKMTMSVPVVVMMRAIYTKNH